MTKLRIFIGFYWEMINCDLITCHAISRERKMQFTISECHTRTISIIFAAATATTADIIYKMHCTFHSKWKILKKNSVWHVKNFLDAVHTHTQTHMDVCSTFMFIIKREKSWKKFSCMSLLLATKTVKNVLDQLLCE